MQHIQLMAQSEYLCLERRLRAKQPEEHPPDQVEQVTHRTFITRFGPSRQADGIYDSDSRRKIHFHARAPRRGNSAARRRTRCNYACEFQFTRLVLRTYLTTKTFETHHF